MIHSSSTDIYTNNEINPRPTDSELTFDVRLHTKYIIIIIITIIQSCRPRMPIDRSSCVDELHRSLSGHLYGHFLVIRISTPCCIYSQHCICQNVRWNNLPSLPSLLAYSTCWLLYCKWRSSRPISQKFTQQTSPSPNKGSDVAEKLASSSKPTTSEHLLDRTFDEVCTCVIPEIMHVDRISS